MPPEPTSSYQELTELQLEILDVIWERGESTVAEVAEALLERRALAITTVATLLSRLQKRGVLTHRTEGRQYVYRPLVSRDEVRESMLSALTHRLFRGDVTALLSHLLTESQITSGDLERVKALIESKTRDTEEHDVR